MDHQVTIRNIWITMSALCQGTGMVLELYDGATAACDGKKMYMPKKWVYSTDPEIQEILLGITVHEAMGHGRHTNFPFYGAYRETTSEFGGSILNIFEDIYIETRSIEAKPGAVIALEQMVSKLTRTGFFGAPDTFLSTATTNPAGLVVSGLLNIGRARLLPRQDTPLAVNIAALEILLPATLGPLWDQIWNIAVRAADSTSTDDSINLTKQVLALIDDQAAGQKGAGTAREMAKAIQRSEDMAMPTTELSDMASKEIDKSARSCKGSDMLVRKHCPSRPVSMNAMQIASSVKSISDDLQDALMAQTRCVRSNRMVGRRLNHRVLTRTRMANPNIFIRKDVGEGLSTAVSLLIDDSGSMGDMKQWTDGLCFGLGDILDEFDVPLEVAVYSETLAYAKYFNDDWTSFRKQRMMPNVSAGTSTGAALEVALGRMACRDEDRRLLILPTDGDTFDMERLESAYSEAQYQGIEIASVMLGGVIPKIEQLAKKFGFEAVSCMHERDLGRYALDRILKAI